MKKLGLKLGKDDLENLTAALPKMLTPKFSKEELRVISLQLSDYNQIVRDFKDLKYFVSQLDPGMPIDKKIENVWLRAKKKGLLSKQQSLSGSLKRLLKQLIQDLDVGRVDDALKQERKDIFGKNVDSWMKRHDGRHSAGTSWRAKEAITQFWEDVKSDTSLRANLADNTKSIYLVVIKHSINQDYDLGTSSLRGFFNELRTKMPKDILEKEKIEKRFRGVTEISVNEFIDFYSGIFHPTTQALLAKPQFLELPKHIRLIYLWEYMKANNLPVPPGWFDALWFVLPLDLGHGVTREKIGFVKTNIHAVEAIRKVFEDQKSRDLVGSQSLKGLSADARVTAFLLEAENEKLPLDIDVKNKRIRWFLSKFLASAVDDGIDKALGLEKIDVVSAKAIPNGMNNGNGVPAEQHVVTLLPADFSEPLDFNGRGSLIIEKVTSIDPKSARKKIARAAKAIIDVLSKEANPNSKIVIVHGIYPKDKNLGLYMERIFKAYHFSVQFIKRPEGKYDVGDLVQERINLAGPNCPAGVYVGTSPLEATGDCVLIARSKDIKASDFFKKIEEEDAKNGQKPSVDVLVGPASSMFINGPDSPASSDLNVVVIETASKKLGKPFTSATKAIGALRDAKAHDTLRALIPTLEAIAENDQLGETLRSMAIWALGDAEAYDTLRVIAENERPGELNDKMRERAIRALGMAEAYETLKAMIVENDQPSKFNDKTRTRAIQALR
ncbi:MAG: HEAT repeat domain-containing protein, partial [Candidatus Omnitrophica bacterium]|nr:HEAT repeat domain-containing protein [Candidatus Omnitrophota bacterium]